MLANRKHHLKDPLDCSRLLTNSGLTSIVEFLEEYGSSKANCISTPFSLNVHDQLDLICLWLDTTLYPYVHKGSHPNLVKLKEQLTKLESSVSEIKNGLATCMSRKPKIYGKVTTRMITCALCDFSMQIPHSCDFWESLHEDNHLEAQCAKLCITKNINKDLKTALIKEDQILEPAILMLNNKSGQDRNNFRFSFNLPEEENMSIVIEHVDSKQFHEASVTSYANDSVANTSCHTTTENVLSASTERNARTIFIEAQGCNSNKLSKLPFAPKATDVAIAKNAPILDYCHEVKQKLYPANILNALKGQYLVQVRNAMKCTCLLCTVDLEISKKVIKSHVNGKKHIKILTCDNLVESLKNYHNFWMQQSADVQMQQRYFNPFFKKCNTCIICRRIVSLHKTLEHLADEEHIAKTEKYQDRQEKLENRRIVENGQSTSNESMSDSNGSSDNPKQDSSSNSNINKLEHTHNFIKSSLEEGKTVIDQLETRFKQHLVHLQLKPECVSCTCCEFDMPLDANAIKRHISTTDHYTRAKIPKRKNIYFCDMCNATVRNESRWSMHITNVPHQGRHKQMESKRKEKFLEYECDCGIVLFGDKLSVIRNQGKFLQDRKRNIKISAKVKTIFKSNENIENIVRQLLKDSNELLAAEPSMMNCCASIEKALMDLYPSCKVYPFGSRVTGLGSIESDLDVFVDIGNMFTGSQAQDANSQKKIIRKVKEVFFKKKNEFADVNPIATARTPIIQVYHLHTNIDCDLSFRHGLSVENTKLLKLCLELQECTRPLILLVKKWARMERLSTNISTYALAMMVIFYLQVNTYLLSVESLKVLNAPSVTIDGWDTIHYIVSMKETKTFLIPNTSTMKENLIGFFTYYAKFNYELDIICPLLGETVKRSLFLDSDDGSSLPTSMASYVRKLSLPEPELFRAKSEICIQDPFDLSHNLTKACQASFLKRFKTLCDLMAADLKALP